MVQIIGKYKRTQEENYSAFLDKLKLNALLKKAATSSTPSMTVSEAGAGKFKIVTATKLKSMEMTFEPGKPFDEKTTDGREVTTTVTVEGNTWTTFEKAKKAGDKDVKIVREFTDDGCKVEFICEDVISKQFFARQ